MTPVSQVLAGRPEVGDGLCHLMEAVPRQTLGPWPRMCSSSHQEVSTTKDCSYLCLSCYPSPLRMTY